MTDSALTASTTPTTSTESSAAQTDRPRSLAYQPALDGVRALAVLAVLLFHAEVAGFSGGYLGVSVFFTLSGFLITNLLLVETRRDGRVDVRAFYARRARRLLPASIACIAGILVVSATTDWFDAVSTLRRDIIGSLLQVANWVFLFGGGSYQELFDQAAGTTSPLEHFWSLAIEEQFYWLWPVVFLWLMRRSMPIGRAMLVLTVLAAAAAPAIAVIWGADAAYWSTPARAAEILIGGLLAVLIRGRRVPRTFSLLAPAALVALALAVMTFPAIGGPAYAGALPLVALVSGALLLGLQVDGPIRRILSVPPLVWVGAISYGVYLYHWPIFVIVDEDRTGLDGAALLILRFALTFAFAQLSFVLLEGPIRRSRSWRVRPTFVVAIGATLAMIIAALVIVPAGSNGYWTVSDEATDAAAIEAVDEPLAALAPTPSQATTAPASTSVPAPDDAVEPPPAADVDPAAVEDSVVAQQAAAATGTARAAAAPPPPLPVLERPVRILVAGDSTAEATGAGLINWAAERPDLAQAELFTVPGCGFMTGGTYVLGDSELEVAEGCTNYVDVAIGEAARDRQVDVVMLMTTAWDVQDRMWEDGLAGSVLDDAVAARLRDDMTALTESILAVGAGSVAWIRGPISDVGWGDDVGPQEDPARHAVIYSVIDELAERYPARVHMIDLPTFVDEAGLAEDRDARPDGVHWTPEAATYIATWYLGEQLIRSALDLQPR